MDEEARSDPTTQLLRDFVDATSSQVRVPAFQPGRRLDGRRQRLSGARRVVGIALVTALALAIVALCVVYGPRSSAHRPQSPETQTSGPDVITLGPEFVQPTVLVARDGKLWVSGYAPNGGAASIEEFDEHTGKLLGTTLLSENSPFEIAAGHNAVWLRTQQGEASTHLVKIDTSTHKIVVNITLHLDGELAVTPDAVWTVDGDGLLRINPETERTIATIPIPGALYPPLIVTAGSLGIWLGSSYDGSVLRVDEQTNTVNLVTHVGSFVNQMVELGTSLWVGTGTALVEVPVSTGTPNRTVEIGSRIVGLSSDGHRLWVTTGPPAGSFRVDPTSGEVTPVDTPSGAKLSAVASDVATGETWATAFWPRPALVRLAP